MKKVLTILSALALTSAFAQTAPTPSAAATSAPKEEKNYLPEEGNFGFTVGAATLLKYTGNFFGKSGENSNTGLNEYANRSSNDVYQGGAVPMIGCKYFIADDLALRAGVRIYSKSTTNNYTVHNDASNEKDSTLYDRVKTTSGGFVASIGIEKRRGGKRIQGIYGADLYVGNYGKVNKDYTYANTITEENQGPSIAAGKKVTADKNSGLNTQTDADPALGYRYLHTQTNNTFGVGLKGFIGVEYFIVPQLSLSGEVFWGFDYTINGTSGSQTEGWDPITKEVKKYAKESIGDTKFNLDVTNVGGAVNLNFYF